MKRACLITLNVFGLFFISAQVFAADRCTGVAPNAGAWAAQQLMEAKSARLGGDIDRAADILKMTAAGLPLLGEGDVSLPGRCMGQQTWQRYYKEKQLTYLELGRRAEQSDEEGSDDFAGFFYFVDGDNRAEIERLLNNIADDPLRFGSVGNRIRGQLSGYQWALDNGFTLLAEERAGQEYYQSRLSRLINRSRSLSNALLRSEADIFDNDLTAEEKQMLAAQKTATNFLGGIVDADLAMPTNEALIDTDRAKRSRRQLTEARRWLSWISAEEVSPILALATERGDMMLAHANDTAAGFEARDDYFSAAIRYYEFAKANDDAAKAKTARAKIEPAMRAARAEREAKLNEKLVNMEASAMEFQRSLKKSDAEKKSFKSEADTLEAELDL